jgi:signal transduction histidine kinase
MSGSEVAAGETAWVRAVCEAQAASEVEDAFAALLCHLGPATGARAAAVAEEGELRVHCVWRCEEAGAVEAIAPLIAGLAENGAPPAERMRLAPSVLDCDGTPSQSALVLPMGQRPGGRIWLLLFFADADEPVPGAEERARAIASLGTLLSERDFHAEETRRARQTRDHFLVAIHHELRTPATALMLEAGLLQSGLLGALPPRLQTSVTRLDGQVNELIRVIRRVLDLASLETAADPPRDDLVDPRETITALARYVEPAADRKGNVLSLFFPRVLPLIQTDAERFRRVLLYLLANALKYTENGRVQVRVERHARPRGATRREPLLVVRIADTGRGIPAEELDRIFEPFAQVEEGARTDSGARGVGLGLPLARRLARSLGGEVLVESTPGEGTLATFLVPYRPASTLTSP